MAPNDNAHREWKDDAEEQASQDAELPKGEMLNDNFGSSEVDGTDFRRFLYDFSHLITACAAHNRRLMH